MPKERITFEIKSINMVVHQDKPQLDITGEVVLDVHTHFSLLEEHQAVKTVTVPLEKLMLDGEHKEDTLGLVYDDVVHAIRRNLRLLKGD